MNSEMIDEMKIKNDVKEEEMKIDRSSKSGIEEADRLFDERSFEEAFDIYSQCAENGDNLSKCRMGMMYYEGLGVEKRPIKAFKLIQESYDPNCPETVFQLGKCHFDGIGTEVNQELGFEMIISAAEAGHPPAENYIAALYLNGEYVDVDLDKGMSWLYKAVDHENPKALYNLGKFHYTNKVPNSSQFKAMDLWKRAAELHYPPALGKMGDEYLRHKDQDSIKKGLECLEKAALSGDGDAAEHLGDYYIKKSDEKEDVKKALDFFTIALKNGNKKVLYDLGMIYSRCPDERDYAKACEYFREGHKNGDSRCSFEYAVMKSRGVGTDTDDELAFKIFLKGAENGDSTCMGWVGHCYRLGIGVNPDDYYAKEWFERGCEKGNAYCTFRLAEFYFRGIAVEINRDYGLKLLRRSFKKGEVQAAYRLGDLYENNSQIKSIPDALYWYMAGAEKRNSDCMMRLAGHYEYGAFIARSEEKAFNLYQEAYKVDNEPVAAAEIGRCFEEGIGTDADIKAAVSWYLRAVKKNAFAMWRLYNIYMDRGETDRAIFWLRRSAVKGSVSAMVELARIYEEGTLIPKSDYKAMIWYHRASDEGNEHAKSRFEELIRFDPQDPDDIGGYEKATRIVGEENDDGYTVCLAQCLERGEEMLADLQKARMWYEIAYQLGVRGAKDGLKRVESLLKDEKQIDSKQTTLD